MRQKQRQQSEQAGAKDAQATTNTPNPARFSASTSNQALQSTQADAGAAVAPTHEAFLKAFDTLFPGRLDNPAVATDGLNRPQYEQVKALALEEEHPDTDAHRAACTHCQYVYDKALPDGQLPELRLTRQLTHEECATVLHGLRLIQCEGRIEGCAAGDCEHFEDGTQPLTNDQIDTLAEAINLQPTVAVSSLDTLSKVRAIVAQVTRDPDESIDGSDAVDLLIEIREALDATPSLEAPCAGCGHTPQTCTCAAQSNTWTRSTEYGGRGIMEGESLLAIATDSANRRRIIALHDAAVDVIKAHHARDEDEGTDDQLYDALASLEYALEYGKAVTRG